MPTGGKVYIVHRKLTVDKPAIVFCDYRETSFSFCGFCGAGCKSRQGENLEDVAQRFVRHCKYGSKDGCACPHPTAERLSEVALARAMADALPSEGTRHMFRVERAALFHEDFVAGLLGEDVVATLTRTDDVRVCKRCLSRETRCCVGRVPMTVTNGGIDFCPYSVKSGRSSERTQAPTR